VVVGAHRNNATTLYLNQLIPCVNKFKYLCINFIAQRTLTIDTASIKESFMLPAIVRWSEVTHHSHIVQVELIKSYSLPNLIYSCA